jgi:hypothetical protein
MAISMTEYVPKVSQCKNCYKKFANVREILLAKNGVWVHTFNNGQHYPTRCNPWESWEAEPMEEE